MTNFEIKNSLVSFKQAIDLMLKVDFLTYEKNTNKKSQYNIFDAYYTIMNLKELIRNLEEAKRIKNSKIYLYISNRYLKSVANLILAEVDYLKDRLLIVNSPRDIQKASHEFNLFIVLGYANKKFLLETLTNNLFVVHIINDLKYQSITGLYNITNNISNVNKLIFLFALIDCVLKDDNFEKTKNIIKETNA